MIYMWQEQRGEPYYRFQTNNRVVAAKMKRRNKFRLVGWGVNCELWIFQAIFGKPETARKALKALAGNIVKYDKNEDLFCASKELSKENKEAA